MNLIMQHWNGDLPRWAQLAERTVRDYANDIGVEYELVRGHPLGKAMGPNPQKLCYIRSLSRRAYYFQTLLQN